MDNARRMILIGSVLGFLSVAIGAFGAHALKQTLEVNQTSVIFETGVHYQMGHALAILILASLCDRPIESNRLMSVGYLFTSGIIIFSGSLYAYALTRTLIFAIVTPLGGLAFLTGWAVLAFTASKPRSA